MSDVTRLLDVAAAGDRRAAADLLPLVYDELRDLAAARLAAEPAGHTLQPTALVHEAYLRLVGTADERRWAHKAHFFAAAAEAMRRILIDHARRRQAVKRSGESRRIPGDPETVAAVRSDGPDLVVLADALERLAAVSPQAAQLVDLRYFAGLTAAEAADALGLAPRTADRIWAYAKAWLFRELGGAAG